MTSTVDIAPTFSATEDRELLRITKLAEVATARLEFATKHHVNTRGESLNFDNYPHIRALYESESRVIVLQGSVQSMKAAPLSSLVHTPGGWSTMGELKAGDIVSTANGKNASIVQVQPRGVQKVYKFILDDGREVETSADHLWKVLRGKQRKSMSTGRKSLQWNLASKFEVLTTKQIMGLTRTGKQRFTVPVPEPVEKPKKHLTLDPYFVGSMLGDGEIHDRNLRFSSADAELVNWISSYVSQFGIAVGRDADTYNYFFKQESNSKGRGARLLKDLFQEMGLLGTYSHTKFIPKEYKEGTVKQRMALLQGLLDTDRSATSEGGIYICLASERLIKDIQEVVWSLGGVAKITKRNSYYVEFGFKIPCRDAYTLTLSMPHPRDCFRLSRKKANVSKTHRRKKTLGAKIVSCDYSREEEVQCIALDDKARLYVMDDYVVTHNSEWVITDHLAMAYCGLAVFFVVPKIESRTTYVQNRINKCVENVDRYKELMSEGSFDSIALKSFGKGTMKYVGSNVYEAFKEHPADALVIEEVDECNQENIPYGKDRLRASPYQLERYLGNPREPGKGINAFFQESKQKEWYIPCLSCGYHCEADWFSTVVRAVADKQGNVVDYQLRDEEWRVGIQRDIHMICTRCGGILNRSSNNGRWIPKLPEHPNDGFHLSMLCSLINDVSEMWGVFRKALDDPILLQQFYNSFLGLPFAAAGNKVSVDLLDKCAFEEKFKFIIQDDCGHIEGDQHPGPCSMGIDVGSHNFDVKVSYVTNRGLRVAMYMGKVKQVDELYDIMDRYNVQIAVIDAEPETALSREIQSTCEDTQVWMCKYKQTEGVATGIVMNENDMLINIDRTEALDKSYGKLKRKKCLLPVNHAAILRGEYDSEMCMPVREAIEDARKRRKYAWTKGKDHQRHCDTYDMLAAELMDSDEIEAVIG